MKKFMLLVIMGVIISCGTMKQSPYFLKEGELFVTRKYIGEYIDFRHTGSESFSGTNLIWIKTSLDSIYGKISAYGKKCEFRAGDRLYLRRTYYTPGGVSSYWEYTVENDSSLFYRITDFQNDHKIMVKSWF